MCVVVNIPHPAVLAAVSTAAVSVVYTWYCAAEPFMGSCTTAGVSLNPGFELGHVPCNLHVKGGFVIKHYY